METITDILGSEFATELEKHRIQIHNVRIMRNLDVIFVYWSCDESGLINPEAAEQLKELEPKVGVGFAISLPERNSSSKIIRNVYVPGRTQTARKKLLTKTLRIQF